MTAQKKPEAVADARLRKLAFRSWHRGMREMDLILGRFADTELAGLNEADLDRYEALLEVQDADLLAWITGGAPIPQPFRTKLLERITAASSDRGLAEDH